MSSDLFLLPPEGVETRWASPENPRGRRGSGAAANGGRKGAPSLLVPAGASVVLAEEPPGVSGTIRRIWMTVPDRTPTMLRGVRLDFFWDGAATPAVSAPLGDFFGIGLGRTAAFECAFFSNPEGRSFCATLPMPFRDGMRLVFTNETDADIPMLFYDVNYTVGDAHPADTLYLHAHFRRENPTIRGRDYAILPRVAGRGRFLGANIGVIPDRAAYGRTWWGEGEVKIFLDGDDALPTLCGTGTEDYVGSAWGLGAFVHRYQGSPVSDDERGAYCFYRYHEPDPVWFRREIRVTIQQIGHAFGDRLTGLFESGKPLYAAGGNDSPLACLPESAEGLLFERQEDWSSVAYFYLDSSINHLPPLPPLAERTVGL